MSKLEIKNWDTYSHEEKITKITDFLSFHGFLIGEQDLDQMRQDSERENHIRIIMTEITNIKKKLNEIIEVLNR